MGIIMFLNTTWYRAEIRLEADNSLITYIYLPRIRDPYDNLLSIDVMCYKPDGSMWTGPGIEDPVTCSEFTETEDNFSWMN